MTLMLENFFVTCVYQICAEFKIEKRLFVEEFYVLSNIMNQILDSFRVEVSINNQLIRRVCFVFLV